MGRCNLNPSAVGKVSVRPERTPRSGGPRQSTAHVAILANGLRRLMSRSQQRCRLCRIAPTIQAVEYRQGLQKRLALIGLSSCKSPLCPLCARKWQRTRSTEIKRAIDHWGERRTVFVTVTMAHRRDMKVGLQQRLLTRAWGTLFAGRAGAECAEALGGKPESIRAHDRTWSFEHGWHPHLHALLFLQREGVSDSEVQAALDARWPDVLRAALASMKKMVRRVLASADEGEALREKATRVFGSKLIHKHCTVRQSALQLQTDLRRFTWKGIRPSLEHGVRAERVRQPGRIQDYLAKLGVRNGIELAGSWDKIGKVGSDGIVHFGLWEVAQLATLHGHPLRVAAGRAWSALFWSTRGTQTVRFSDREKLGLGPDPYAEGEEPEEQAETETRRLLGEIDGEHWDQLKKEQGHGLLVSLHVAYEKGLLEDLPYVTEPSPYAGTPQATGPPERAPPRPEWWNKLEAETAAMARGARVVREAYARAAAPPVVERHVFLEELRRRLSHLWREEEM